MNAKEIRDELDTKVAIELGIPVEEARELVDKTLATLAPPIELEPTPYEAIRKTPKPPKNLSWPATLDWYREHAHEVWESPNGWKHYVLKSYQKGRGELDSDQYARAFCLVDGYESELGDVYWRDITSGKRVR